MRVAQHDGLTGRCRAHDVGHEPVGRPVAAADHVAASGGGHRDPAVGEERLAVRGGHKLLAAFDAL